MTLSLQRIFIVGLLLLALAFSFAVVVPAYAQTATTTLDAGAGVTDTTATPALPDTGAGGNATSNLAVLIATGAIAVVGATLLARRYATR